MIVTINGKEIDLELTEEQKAAVKEALRIITGWERASDYREEYYFIGADEEINFCEDNYTNVTGNDYQNANYFNSKELAENIARAQTLQRKLWRRSAELCEKIDWYEEKNTYCIFYDYTVNNCYAILVEYCRDFGQVYFDTKEHAEQVIEEFRDELTWYFTEFKDRMDGLI